MDRAGMRHGEARRQALRRGRHLDQNVRIAVAVAAESRDRGIVADGLLDIDAPHNVNGALDASANPDSDFVYGLGIGYGFHNGFRLELYGDYRNTDASVADTFTGTKPLSLRSKFLTPSNSGIPLSDPSSP